MCWPSAGRAPPGSDRPRWGCGRSRAARSCASSGTRLARPADELVELAPRQRDRHPHVLEVREHLRAHRHVRALVARRGQVRAHQPRGRLGRHPLGVRHRCHAAPAGAPRSCAAASAGPGAACGPCRADIAAPARPERPRPQPRRAQPGHRQRPAGLGQLQRHPAAEGVPGHVGAPTVPRSSISPPTASASILRRRASPLRGPGERPKPGRSTAITSRSRARRSITGSQTTSSAPSG